MAGFFQDDPFPVDPGQARWAEQQRAFADACELERIALAQLEIDLAAWDYVVDLDHFIRGERIA